jgi:hypothetical protein
MPLVDYNLKSTFDVAYNDSGGYSRDTRPVILRDAPLRLAQVLHMQPGEPILIVGAGYGWIAEEWLDMGLGPICPVDTSEWIQSSKYDSSTIEIYSLDVSKEADVQRIHQLLDTTRIEWVITENVLPVLTDDECETLSRHLHSFCPNIIHYMQTSKPHTDPQKHNWKSADEWKDLLPADRIVDYFTYQVT